MDGTFLLAGFGLIQFFEEARGKEVGSYGEVAGFGGAAVARFAGLMGESADAGEEFDLGGRKGALGCEVEKAVARSEGGVGLFE